MYKDQVFAIGIIALLVGLVLFLYLENQDYKFFARVVVDEWGAREDRLVSLCQIDYNQALINERNVMIFDMNDFVLRSFGGG